MNQKLKLAGDAMWLAIEAFELLQNEADENKGLLSNDIQYEIATILELVKPLFNVSLGIMRSGTLEILSNLNNEADAIDLVLAARFKQVFGYDIC
jgi:hypothetical protein